MLSLVLTFAGNAQFWPPAPQDMVACALCGLHLPRPDAVSGNDGRLYCSQEHRQSAAGGP